MITGRNMISENLREALSGEIDGVLYAMRFDTTAARIAVRAAAGAASAADDRALIDSATEAAKAVAEVDGLRNTRRYITGGGDRADERRDDLAFEIEGAVENARGTLAALAEALR